MSQKSRDGWSDKQHQDFDEWSAHYSTYEKWLANKPEQHQLYDMSVRNIKRRASLAYFRGFLDSIAHLVAVVQNSLESKEKDIDKDSAAETLAEYGRLLLGCAAEQLLQKTSDKRVEGEEEEEERKEKEMPPLYAVAQNALPREKERDFYAGFVDGYQQLNRIVVKIYADQQTFGNPFAVLKSIFYLQSGFCVGCMIENWPKECVPRYRR